MRPDRSVLYGYMYVYRISSVDLPYVLFFSMILSFLPLAISISWWWKGAIVVEIEK